jgi:hypothetical protein
VQALSLNDPFGRVARKNARAYGGLRERLRQQGVRSRDDVDAFVRGITATALKITLVLLAVWLAASVVFPQLTALSAVFVLAVLAWIAAGYLQTRLMLRRYVREEFGDR